MSQPDDRTPGFHDADLLLKLYDLRREPVMRASRDAISFGFWPTSWDEFAAILDFSNSSFVRDAFIGEVQQHYARFYEVEVASFDAAVTDWERVRYFDRI